MWVFDARLSSAVAARADRRAALGARAPVLPDPAPSAPAGRLAGRTGATAAAHCPSSLAPAFMFAPPDCTPRAAFARSYLPGDRERSPAYVPGVVLVAMLTGAVNIAVFAAF